MYTKEYLNPPLCSKWSIYGSSAAILLNPFPGKTCFFKPVENRTMETLKFLKNSLTLVTVLNTNVAVVYSPRLPLDLIGRFRLKSHFVSPTVLLYFNSRTPEQCPSVVSLLSESYNPHVRYGAAIALGISCAGTGLKVSLKLMNIISKGTPCHAFCSHRN